jgi:hypothetical protein
MTPIPKLRNASQPPLSHSGAIPDSDRAKRPPLGEIRASNQEIGSRAWAISESRREKLAQLSELTKKARSSSGMTTVARDSTSRRSREFREPGSLMLLSSQIADTFKDEHVSDTGVGASKLRMC